MTLTPSAARTVRRAIESAKSPEEAKDSVIALCERAEKAARESAARIKAREPRAKGATKETRTKSRNERAAEIRAAVMERAGECCEWCHRGGFALEWAHIFGGGERRHREDVTNTAANCWDCHRGWERANPETVRNAKEWAIRHGFREALREIEHRMAKAEEARR